MEARRYLNADQIDRLRKAAKSTGRHGHRDSTFILTMFRHGLRVTEAINLTWKDVALDDRAPSMFVHRLKGSTSTSQPVKGDEIRALRKLKRLYPSSPQVFCNERKNPMTPRGIQQVIKRAGEIAGFEQCIHPHMLRHSCGYYLAEKGFDTRMIQDYLGHRNIQHTVHYTAANSERFNKIRW